MQLSLPISAQSDEATMCNPEELIFEYVATSVAPIIGSWPRAIRKMIVALWMCNRTICNILIEVLWSFEKWPLFTLYII